MNIQKACLGVVSLPVNHVEGMLIASSEMSLEKLRECFSRLCLSHERLRAEVAGCEVLLEQDSDRKPEGDRPWAAWLRAPQWESWHPKVGVTQWEMRLPSNFDSVSRFCVTEWHPGEFEAAWVGHRGLREVFDALEAAKGRCEELWRGMIAEIFK